MDKGVYLLSVIAVRRKRNSEK